MSEIRKWLEGIGLAQYAEIFESNDLDIDLLGQVDDQILKDIGISSAGHRLRIRSAIAKLSSEATLGKDENAWAETSGQPNANVEVRQPTPGTAPTATPVSAASQVAGERRYLTVMFCDLVGSTGISAQLDAEEWRDLVGAYLDAASAAVVEMGGHVAKKLGDGLLALFGYPLAHENDAERAARAALSIQRALAELNRKNADSGRPELTARIGLETGPAVLDAAGEIYGDVANIAARVQALAEPGAVLVTTRVQRQVAGLFVAEERGTHNLKGVSEPVALFRIVRASGGGRRSGQRQLTPFVGREDEITMLMRRWERARQGDGQLVIIVGEPGLGKTRLLEEFHSRLADTPHTWVEWSCSQLLQNTPLHPIAEWGRLRFGGADEPADRRLAELESSLAQVKLNPTENVPLVAPLLDIPLPKERVPSLAAEELRRRQLAALTNWVMASARTQPLVLAFEDLHWADPTTLDVLRGIAERGALAPLYIVATTRPEFRPLWGMRSHHSTISLAPLDRQQVRDMVAELSARHALAKDVVEDVAARTGGVPLFVEEVTRLLLERGEQGGVQAIPPTLQQSLMARLDRLGPAREVAQIGSVIGRGFSYALLRDVAGMEDAALQAALEKLAEADIVLVQGLPPEGDYRFKHALIQDAAYENLLKSRRQVLHRRVAEILRNRFDTAAESEPEVLAHHFTQAGLTDAAIEWWGKAGDQALRRSAFQEAISHLGKAIEMADKAGEVPRGASGSAPTSQRLKLQSRYGQALTFGKGYAAPETSAAFARARELAATIGDATERFHTYYGHWAGSVMRGEYRLARETAAAFLREAEQATQMREVATAHRINGLTRLWQGEFGDARTHLTEALRISDPQRDRDIEWIIGADTRACATIYLAQTNWLLGEFEQIRPLIEEAIARAIELDHVPTLTNAYFHTAILETLRGDALSVLRASEALVQLSKQHDVVVFLALGNMTRGWARARLGERDAGTSELSEGLKNFALQGNKAWAPLFAGLLAELEGESLGTEPAPGRIDEAIALAQETGEHGTDAFLHRVRGEILLKRDPTNTAPAEEAFLAAIAIAQAQKARSFELRAALSLGKVYNSTDRTTEAHAVLAPALEGFSPTPEFPEVAEAQILFAALAENEEVKKATAARQRRLKLQTSFGTAMMWSKGYGAEETKAAFARARDFGADIGDFAERSAANYGHWANSHMRGEFTLARESAEIFLHEAENEGRLVETSIARRMLGYTCLFLGNFTESRGHLEEALRIYDPGWDSDDKFRLSMEPGLTAMAYLAEVEWILGEVRRGRHLIDESVARSMEAAHVPTLANSYSVRAEYEIFRGDVGAVLLAGKIAFEYSREHELGHCLPMARIRLGWARARLGEHEAGVFEMRQGLADHIEHGNRAWVPLFQGLLADIEAEVEGADRALGRIDEALALARETGERWTDAFLHRIRGDILLKRYPADPSSAEEAFRAAIGVARQQKARSFELRAAMSMVRLWRDQGKREKARELLAAIYGRFTEGFDTLDLKEAKALLDELHA